VDRFSELKAKASALEIQARAIQQCRAEIRQLGQRIREAGDETLRERAETILPDGRTARIGNIKRLIAIREALSAMLDAIESAPDPEPRALKTSDAPEEKCAPNIQNKKSSRKRTAQSDRDPLDRIKPTTALSVATDGYRSVVEALGGPTWPNLVEASWRSCGRLGIAQSTWGRACQQFGRKRAALSVLLIDRNFELPTGHRYRVFSPARCLAGITRRAKLASVNLAGMFRASEREAGLGSGARLGSVSDQLAPPLQPAGPMTHLARRLMATFEQSIEGEVCPDIPAGERVQRPTPAHFHSSTCADDKD
jgi:hypothetical protein